MALCSPEEVFPVLGQRDVFWKVVCLSLHLGMLLWTSLSFLLGEAAVGLALAPPGLCVRVSVPAEGAGATWLRPPTRRQIVEALPPCLAPRWCCV